MDDRSPDLLRPTLIAGVVFGVLASIPFVNLLNCLCCALVLGCGFFAAKLYAGDCRERGHEFRPGSGAMVGLVAGAFYAMTRSLVDTVLRLLIGDPTAKWMLELVRNLPNLPAETRDAMEELRQAAESTPTVSNFIVEFFLWVLVAAIFSTVGGLIGGAVFRVAPPAATPPAQSPFTPPGPGGDPGAPAGLPG